MPTQNTNPEKLSIIREFKLKTIQKQIKIERICHHPPSLKIMLKDVLYIDIENNHYHNKRR